MLLLAVPAIAPADDILVPGKPPLSRSLMDRFRRFQVSVLDIQLTPAQRRRWEELFLAEFKKKGAYRQQQLVLVWQKDFPIWQALADLNGAARVRAGLVQRPKILAALRKSPDQDDKLLVAIYDTQHRPGGRKNPLLATGDPPLTRDLMEVRFAFAEWLFDLPLTDQQRADYERLFKKDWKARDRDSNRSVARGTEMLTEAASSWSPYYRNLARSLYLPRALAIGHSKDASAGDRWLVGWYTKGFEPGTTRNPILVKGEPALTQALVDRYGDYLEWVFNLSLTGGMTPAQRRQLRDFVVGDWKKNDQAGREAFLATLKQWARVAPLGAKEWRTWRDTLQPKLLAQLRNAGDHDFSRWLLSLYAREQELLRLALQAERIRHQLTMESMRAIGESAGPPRGYVEVFNHSTGRYEYRPR
jgi:hypothetical protein